ncbi:LacI family DNA-binding transcriptional regulator [Lactobacillus sp. ESL0679]|uniref:LacI family DNA-binding transcriptional regulator n=1 Tax=Lactobacillus sp. ESL0679 TaxID=2983209 RepID=UPI0023F925A9|nr:LacI family DNA-binding transcriptional regulator [Lactobacillus sp. ESL0679]MDF7682092.1 LacI family DNA-binding transcriptional regulator [Lactobacillus sp. ESL0679]
MRPKLSDVAKKAGVSVTTVSRVINNYGYLSKETKAKVKLAMQELNYQPNSVARSLQGKQTYLIGIIFPNISNPFFGELVERLECLLFAKGYKTILCNSANDPQKEHTYLQMLMANQVDGIISGAHNLGIKEYQQTNLPMVSFDRNLSADIPIVSADNYRGAQMATAELYRCGCRQIYYLGNANIEGNPTDQRLRGYRDYMKAKDLKAKVCSLNYGDTKLIKMMLIKKLLEQDKVDGIVCSDDLTAILVCLVAEELKIKVPQDLMVIGFDGTQLIRDYFPQLTTIKQPLNDIASLLIKLLLQRIKHPDQKFKNTIYTLPVELCMGKTVNPNQA